MGVYIKGMDMPNNCQECECINDEYFYCQAVGRQPQDENIISRRPDWCPLVEVLPHGDLIDRDGLMKTLEITEECEKCKSHVGVHCTRVYFVGACEAICDAPTIIEAEE